MLANSGNLYITYLNEGGPITIEDNIEGMNFQWIDPKTGQVSSTGTTEVRDFMAPSTDPWVLIVYKE